MEIRRERGIDMFQLSLRPEARDLLERILQDYLGDLRVEIGDTCDYEYRNGLKGEEKAVREILDALCHTPQAV